MQGGRGMQGATGLSVGMRDVTACLRPPVACAAMAARRCPAAAANAEGLSPADSTCCCCLLLSPPPAGKTPEEIRKTFNIKVGLLFFVLLRVGCCCVCICVFLCIWLSFRPARVSLLVATGVAAGMCVGI
jgi:hypothetical protein